MSNIVFQIFSNNDWFQLFVFLVKTLEVYVMETVGVHFYGKISPLTTRPMFLALY